MRTYPKNISAEKKGKDKKVQVTEWPKDVISLWGQEKKLYQLGCTYIELQHTKLAHLNNYTLAAS